MVTLNSKTHLFLILGIAFLNAIENIEKTCTSPPSISANTETKILKKKSRGSRH